jgi:hypothetical protein
MLITLLFFNFFGTAQLSTDTSKIQVEFNYFSIIMLLFSTLCLIPSSYLITADLIFGIIDFRRRRALMNVCTRLIELEDCTDENRKYPLINIFDYNTLKNWYLMRNILMDYGMRFSQRIIMHTTIFCLLSILGLVSFIMTLLGVFSSYIGLVIFI